jgi:hypothetical protein
MQGNTPSTPSLPKEAISAETPVCNWPTRVIIPDVGKYALAIGANDAQRSSCFFNVIWAR